MRAGQTEEVTDSWPHAAPRSWMVSAAWCQQAGALWRFLQRQRLGVRDRERRAVVAAARVAAPVLLQARAQLEIDATFGEFGDKVVVRREVHVGLLLDLGRLGLGLG